MMNVKKNFKAGLGFGATLAIYFILKDILTADNLTLNHIVKILVAGIIPGTLSAVIFGWFNRMFLNSQYFNKSTPVVLEKDEDVLFETPANHFKGVEGVGGKLYLTNTRLIFKSHKLNIQNHQLEILLTDIKEFGRYKTLGLINNGLQVKNDQGAVEKFVVQQPAKWVRLMSGAIPFLHW